MQSATEKTTVNSSLRMKLMFFAGCFNVMAGCQSPQPPPAAPPVAAAEITTRESALSRAEAAFAQCPNIAMDSFVIDRLKQIHESLAKLRVSRARAEADWAAYLIGELDHARLRECLRCAHVPP